MVYRVKFVKELRVGDGLKTISDDPFLPLVNDLIYTVTVDSNNFAHFFIGSSEVAGGLHDSFLKLITTGHAHLVAK